MGENTLKTILEVVGKSHYEADLQAGYVRPSQKAAEEVQSNLVNAGKTSFDRLKQFGQQAGKEFADILLKATEVEKKFKEVAAIRINAGNIGSLTKEIVAAQSKARISPQTLEIFKKNWLIRTEKVQSRF